MGTHRSAPKHGSSRTKTPGPCTTQGVMNSTQPSPQFAATLSDNAFLVLVRSTPRPTPHHPSPCNPLYILVHRVEHNSRLGVTITVGRDWAPRRRWGSWIRVTSTRWRCEIREIGCIQGVRDFVCSLYAALLTAFDVYLSGVQSLVDLRLVRASANLFLHFLVGCVKYPE